MGVEAKVKMFKAKEENNRYNLGQKVWIKQESANHLKVRHKFRGSGRYVNATLSKDSAVVGEIKEIEVNEEFALRHNLQIFLK